MKKAFLGKKAKIVEYNDAANLAAAVSNMASQPRQQVDFGRSAENAMLTYFNAFSEMQFSLKILNRLGLVGGSTR